MKRPVSPTARAMHDAITSMVEAVQDNRGKRPDKDPLAAYLRQRVPQLFDDPEEQDEEQP